MKEAFILIGIYLIGAFLFSLFVYYMTIKQHPEIHRNSVWWTMTRKDAATDSLVCGAFWPVIAPFALLVKVADLLLGAWYTISRHSYSETAANLFDKILRIK